MAPSYGWFIYYGGSSVGLVLHGPQGPNEAKISYALKFSFVTSNYEAEYENLIAGLKLGKDVGAEKNQNFLRFHAGCTIVDGRL